MKITDSYVHFWVFLRTSRWKSPLTHNGDRLVSAQAKLKKTRLGDSSSSVFFLNPVLNGSESEKNKIDILW